MKKETQLSRGEVDISRTNATQKQRFHRNIKKYVFFCFIAKSKARKVSNTHSIYRVQKKIKLKKAQIDKSLRAKRRNGMIATQPKRIRDLMQSRWYAYDRSASKVACDSR